MSDRAIAVLVSSLLTAGCVADDGDSVRVTVAWRLTSGGAGAMCPAGAQVQILLSGHGTTYATSRPCLDLLGASDLVPRDTYTVHLVLTQGNLTTVIVASDVDQPVDLTDGNAQLQTSFVFDLTP